MSLDLHKRARNEMLAGLGAQLAGGKLRIYAGARPVATTAAAQATLLVEFVFATPAATVSDGTLKLAAVPKAYALAEGKARWFRCTNAKGLVLLDGDMGSDLALSREFLEPGDEISITSLVLVL